MNNTNHPRPSGFLTFIFAFAPGIPHLYMGLPVKGLTLLGSFAACVVLMIILGSGYLASVFVVPLIMIYAYSFFDAFHCRRAIISGQHPEDNSLITDYIRKIVEGGGSSKARLLSGIALVTIGIAATLGTLNGTSIGWLSRTIMNLIIPAAFILGGILLIKKGLRK